MRCKRVTGGGTRLMDPKAGAWMGVGGEAVAMDATPLANQPSEYIKASLKAEDIGKVRSLMVQAAHDGKDIFFRLSWEDESQNVEIGDNNTFVDACGILMPLRDGDPPIDAMGDEKAPVNAWYWRADQEGEKARNVVARGLGTTETTKRSAIRAQSLWGQGAWAVVISRPLSVVEQKEEAAQLAAGGKVKVGFAVWEGSNGERAGVKSFSKAWQDLELDA